ncbi:MAG: AAA family ATPase [Firmicutes bacterium]|nr:AAA family ATPase [Bacillota bacterium]
MGISRIAIKNFTVFDELKIDFCEGINVFIGENGTGKTHLLKLLYSTCKWKMNEAGYSHNDISIGEKILACFQNVRYSELFNIAHQGKLSYKGDIREEDEITIKSTINGQENTYDIWGFNEQHSGYDYRQSRPADEPYPAVYIPAKDMLTHARLEKDYSQRNLPLDITLIDIINKAGVSTIRNLPEEMKVVLYEIEKIIGGKVVYKSDRFYIKNPDGTLMEFALVAEGFKKLGLIFRLIETGYFTNGSVLFWDEPEANLNPKLIPVLVDILLKLEQAGVQMFLATHDYVLAKYLEINKPKNSNLQYHSFYKSNSKVLLDSKDTFEDIDNNPISDSYNTLLDKVFEVEIKGE